MPQWAMDLWLSDWGPETKTLALKYVSIAAILGWLLAAFLAVFRLIESLYAFWRDGAINKMTTTAVAMSELASETKIEMFKQYRRKQIAELRPWQLGDDLSSVSISAPDKEAGSPKTGDMIARNPKNHADQWLVSAQYFADNFELA